MAVITFSRQFPAYHPRKGQATRFVEKILTQRGVDYQSNDYFNFLLVCNGENANGKLSYDEVERFFLSLQPLNGEDKHHTIRGGHRWKAGDTFSPRVWSGKPYNSPQIIIAPDIEVVKTWDFELIRMGDCDVIRLDGQPFGQLTAQILLFKDSGIGIRHVAQNDGLELRDFIDWFTLSPSYKKEQHFHGQIISWSTTITY